MLVLLELIIGVLFIGITYVPGRVFGRPLKPLTACILRLAGTLIIVFALLALASIRVYKQG